jgi:hypothetical protein
MITLIESNNLYLKKKLCLKESYVVEEFVVWKDVFAWGSGCCGCFWFTFACGLQWR